MHNKMLTNGALVAAALSLPLLSACASHSDKVAQAKRYIRYRFKHTIKRRMI